jgi:hypothetical protein
MKWFLNYFDNDLAAVHKIYKGMYNLKPLKQFSKYTRQLNDSMI